MTYATPPAGTVCVYGPSYAKCQFTAKYVVPRVLWRNGEPKTQDLAVCGVHKNSIEGDNKRWESFRRAQLQRDERNAAESVAVNLATMLNVEIGPGITFSTDGAGLVTLSVKGAKALLARLSS